MLQKLNEVSSNFISWMEGCSFHGWLRARSGGQPAVIAKRLQEVRRVLDLPQHGGDGFSFLPCPRSGQRAVELATGAMQAVLEEASADGLAELLEICGGDCSDAALEQIMADYQQGRSRMTLYLSQKPRQWAELPWRLAAVAQPDEGRARAAAVELFDYFRRPSGV